MRIFIDSANIEEIKDIHRMGFLDGVTTNPSLVAKEKRDYHQVIREIAAIVDGPISAEVISLDLQGMLQEAGQLAELHSNVVIKIPLTATGLQAISLLKQKNIETNATLVFSANQALLAARAGADFVSPFIGRVDDNGNDGMKLLEEIISIYDQYMIDTEIIAASIRHPMHVTEAAKLGSHIATVPYKVILQMIQHPMTAAGIERFLDDWKQYI